MKIEHMAGCTFCEAQLAHAQHRCPDCGGMMPLAWTPARADAWTQAHHACIGG